METEVFKFNFHISETRGVYFVETCVVYIK